MKEWRKEMFYLTMRSKHFIYGYNGVRHKVKYHSDSKRGNLLLPLHELSFLISSKGFVTNHPTGLCYTSCEALAGLKNCSVCSPYEGLILQPITQWADIFYIFHSTRKYLSKKSTCIHNSHLYIHTEHLHAETLLVRSGQVRSGQ